MSEKHVINECKILTRVALRKNGPFEGRVRNGRITSKMALRKIGCKNGWWMELASYRVQWRVLVLAVLKSRNVLEKKRSSWEN
jgi:ribosomal protein L15E